MVLLSDLLLFKLKSSVDPPQPAQDYLSLLLNHHPIPPLRQVLVQPQLRSSEKKFPLHADQLSVDLLLFGRLCDHLLVGEKLIMPDLCSLPL